MKFNSVRGAFLALAGTCLAILAGVPAVQAQLPTGDIVGTVTDASGGALPGATVTATNTGTGEVRTVQTSSSGDYSFTLLQLGTYSVAVRQKASRS